MVLKIREGLMGECLGEDLGCCADVPDPWRAHSQGHICSHHSTASGWTWVRTEALWPQSNEGMDARGPGIHRRHSSFPGAEKVTQVDFLP